MSIFGNKDKDQVRVPEIEVRGDEVQVHPAEKEPDQNLEQKPQERTYRLPKTKWF